MNTPKRSLTPAERAELIRGGKSIVTLLHWDLHLTSGDREKLVRLLEQINRQLSSDQGLTED